MSKYVDWETERVFQIRAERCVLLSGITLMIWDFVENVLDDILLFTAHPVRLPSVVYLLARMSTLAFLISMLAPSNVHTTSILLYFRVHALYRSNRWVQVFFLISCLGVIASCFIWAMVSGLCSGIFDIAIAIAILIHLRLGWLRGVGQRFWLPFRSRPEAPITDKILQDSLGYVLLAVVIKIPQILLVSALAGGYWELYSVYLDAAIMCIISAKIFRDMKLGYWTATSRPIPGLDTPPTSGLRFDHHTQNSTLLSNVG
ncbi:hypothetical protein CPB83DRAFT_886588 [Crepidotus variabilis]|uniref:Uncharacterized protein n=1 Tax=Crepidotus variabilis TaxID=179855 RepID=A0A9P6JKL9_9AGAR|nr:hypothetical protein CPB83DRAFT_886588 [Crepidotus variabilis]